MNLRRQDVQVLRDLGHQIAEIGIDPVNEKRKHYRSLVDNLQPGKPTIQIYQIPWHEMNVENELTLRTEDPFCRQIETSLRQTIYQWKHMPGDMVVYPSMSQPLVVHDSGFGIDEDVEIRQTDVTSSVVSRHFRIQIKNEQDIDKIKMPRVTFDAEQTEAQYQIRQQIFAGILPVRKSKRGSFWFAPWDDLVRWTGVQEILMDMVLRPDYVHQLIRRLVDAWLYRLDQFIEQDLFSKPPMQLWGIGAAQIFSEVSPEMHAEFALAHEARWFRRFGFNYYGCCEPLHHKVDIIRQHIPRLKKISISPWVDFDKAVENVGDNLIFAWKPNPAVLAAETWEPDAVRRDLEDKLRRAGSCIVEIHLKDISTVRYQPQRLWQWAEIAAEVTEDLAR